MKFEPVYTVREFYDGIRCGTADYLGMPHYFSSSFDNARQVWTDYRLHPLPAGFMKRELRQWAIFRSWEARFHRGLETVETHPDGGGISAEYDELESWLEEHIGKLQPLTPWFQGQFRTQASQDELSIGILRKLEVAWCALPGQI